MAATRFSALYCSQLYRNKKVKNWLDGYVEVNGSKITLLDERNEVVESLYRTGRRLGEGDDVEFDKWYCTVEGALQNVGGTAPVAKKMSQSTPRYDTPRTPLPAPQSTSVRKKFSLTVTPRAPTPIQASSTQDDEAPMPSPLPKSISHRVSEPLREIEQPHETIRARANAQPQSQLQLQTPSKPATPVNPRAPRSSDELLQLFGMSDEEDDELDAPVPIVFDAAATAVMQDGVPLASASPRLNGTKRPADVGTSLVSEGGEDLVVSKRRRIVPSVDAVSEPPKSASTIPAVNQPAGTPSKPLV
ncbi:uncharacterized protein EV422DRAFT_534914 [Fimicolochytrium jonesii]|uniref:uncharacterized protein n=1 Tax=Fimicolochytrium jonesii TaxID=1396493 RepID=UPI0022FEED66|nr:uncharacterized protein EV422DRAFT_534914 [Fimicolochytrium jonesii]KAI8819485.1 hypothetical protein EV422DRAFT_534914 [Fimicolochytrium jonesii]